MVAGGAVRALAVAASASPHYEANMTLGHRFAAHDRAWLRLSPGQNEARSRVLAKLHDGTYELEATPCFCGGPPRDLEISLRDRYGLPVRTVLCEHCGLMRSDPRMTAAAAARFYDEHYRDLYTGPGNGEALYRSQVARGRGLTQLLAKLLPQIERVYEVGCGAGGLLAPFAELGKQVAGVDLGGEYLEVGRGHGLALVQGDASALLAAQGRTADLVLLMHVFEHYHDLHASAAELATLLDPGGVLLVEVPGIATIGTHYRSDLLSYLQNAHNYHFTATTLEFVLRRCGFDVLACTESGVALCQKPEAPTATMVPPPRGEAARVLDMLRGFEAAFVRANAA